MVTASSPPASGDRSMTQRPNEPSQAQRTAHSAEDATGGLLKKGTLIKDSWRIVEFAGEGGAGAVYIAEHRSLGQHVAVKTLFGKFLRDKEMRRRFLEEAIIQANLNHPNIARVTDVIDDGSLCAIIMEYIDGSSLDKALSRLEKPMSIEACCRLMLALLDGMNYAHAQGVVHRDIKPANILLASTSDGVQPKITDFGIAKVLSDHRRTETGTAMGTVYYASPEQLTDAKSVDHRADVYSLGCTFFELLTHSLPFEDTSMYGVMRLHVQGPRPDPRDRRPEIPEALAHVIVRAMAIAPSDRPQTCAEFAEEIRAAMGSDALTSHIIRLPSGATQSARRPAGLSSAPLSTNTQIHDAGIAGRSTPVSTGVPPGPARTIEPELRFTGPARPRTLPRPERHHNPVAIGIWVLIGGVAIGLVALIVSQMGTDPPAIEGPPATTPLAVPTPPSADQVVAAPVDAIAPSAPDVAPPTEAPPEPVWTLQGCETLVEQMLRHHGLGTVPRGASIPELELGEAQCPCIYASAAGESVYDALNGELNADVLRYQLQLVLAEAAERAQGDGCREATSATTAAERALRRIRESERNAALHHSEVAMLQQRAPVFQSMHQAVVGRFPLCPFAPLPVALGGPSIADGSGSAP